MSSSQILDDTGVIHGIRGRFNAPNHTGNPKDPYTVRNLAAVNLLCGGQSVLLTAQHEPRRILTLADSECLSNLSSNRVITTPAAGVFLVRADMAELKIATICMPVCDHATVGVQIVGHKDQVLAAAMLRVKPDRASGDESEIAALFERIKSQGPRWYSQVTEVHFHLSAGRGPCCMPKTKKSSSHIADNDDIAYEHPQEEGCDDSHGLDMLELLDGAVREAMSDWNGSRRLQSQSLAEFTLHKRDTGCTVCCAELSGKPYFNGDKDGPHAGNNLAFFHTAREIPTRPPWW